MKSFLAAVIVIIAFSGLAAEPEIKGTATELSAYIANLPKSVIISAEGEARAQADKGIITLRVVTEAKGLQPALKANQDAKGKFVSFVKDRGLAEGQIQGARFSSTGKQSIFSDKVKSYRVDNQLKVTVKDDKEFQTVAAAVDFFSEVHFGSIEFENSEKDQLKNNAIAQAVDKALAERKVYEEKLGVRLVPKRFSTVANPTPAEMRRAYAEQERPSVSTVTGILTDPSFNVTIRALESREDSTSVFGEIVSKVFISFEFSVETK